MGGAYFVLLSSLGLAMTVQAQGCTKPAGTNMVLKNDFNLLTQFREGITVAFACDVGYQAVGGSGKITCTNGNWSPLTLKCQRKSCGSAGEIENGAIDYDEGIEFGAKATVTCNEGYDLVGNRELFCGDEGWMNRLPVCEVVKCDPPSKILNGIFSPVKDSYAYDEVIKYSCISDYTLNGSNSLICSDGGKFKPNPPKCTRVECQEPDIQYAKWKTGSRPPYRFKSFVTYECEKGFTLKGDNTITCDINSQWSPGLPKCIPIEVTTKATTTTTTTTTTSTGPKDKIPDTYTPTGPPDSGGNVVTGVVSTFVVGVGAAVIGVVVKTANDKNKKSKQISQDKTAANNGGAELRAFNTTDDVKDDVTEPMNSIP